MLFAGLVLALIRPANSKIHGTKSYACGDFDPDAKAVSAVEADVPADMDDEATVVMADVTASDAGESSVVEE